MYEMQSKLKYWDWMALYSKTNSDGEYLENPLANPDVLSETNYPWEYERDDDHDEAVKEIVSQLKLSKREVQVITLMQQGATQYQAASILKISRNSVKVLIERMRNKVRKCVTQNPDLAVMVRGIVK
jgi:DNA-binding NarL/FixJ family response regulator